MALPVAEIVTIANVLVDVSGKLFKTYKNRKRVEPPDPEADPKDQVQSLLEQLHQLEAVQEKQAELIVQLTEQVQSVTVALADQSRQLEEAREKQAESVAQLTRQMQGMTDALADQARRGAQMRWALAASVAALCVSLGAWWSVASA